MSIIIKSGSSQNLASVDANNNLKVALPENKSQAGFVRLTNSDQKEIKISGEDRLKVGSDNIMFYEGVDGTAVNTINWKPSQSNMSQSQTQGWLTLNSGNSDIANAYSILTSVKQPQMLTMFSYKIIWGFKFSATPQANATLEWGAGFVAGITAPTLGGIYFRMGTTFKAVANWNGVEVVSADLTPPSINTVHFFSIVVQHNSIKYYVRELGDSEDTLLATITPPATNPMPIVPTHIPAFVRIYNGPSAPATALKVDVCLAMIIQEDLFMSRIWRFQMASLGRGSFQSPVSAFLQTANHANSGDPVSATLSNTNAGYNTLGGRYQFALVAGSTTDYALFVYQVPTGMQLYLHEIGITAVNTGAVNHASTETILDWAIGVNASEISLATADTPPTSWGVKRLPLGVMSLLGGALKGTILSGSPIKQHFEVPLVVESGRYVHIILQVPVGAATNNQIIRGDVFFNGYFE